MISQNLRENDISALALGQLKETVEKSAVNSEVGSLKWLDAQDLKIFRIVLGIELMK